MEIYVSKKCFLYFVRTQEHGEQGQTFQTHIKGDHQNVFSLMKSKEDAGFHSDTQETLP